MKRPRPRFDYGFYVFLLGCACLAFSTFAAPSPTSYPQVLRLGFQKSSTLFVVKLQGGLEKRLEPLGVKVEWAEFPFGPPMLEALNAGRIDYATTGETPPVFAQAARNAQLVYVGQEPSSPESEAILLPKDSNIHALADLKGKKVAVAKGANAHYLLISALAKAGLGLGDIQPVYLAPADAYAAFERGAVDAWAIWDFYRAGAEIKLGAKRLADATGLANNFENYTARREFARQYPALLAAVLDEIAKTEEGIAAHPEQAADLMAPHLGLPPETVLRGIKRRRYGAGPVTPTFVDSQQKIADALHGIGLLPHPIDIKQALP
jgi:sulfonate transport system substrate-binding protein